MDGFESLSERVEALAGLVNVEPSALSGDQALAWTTALIGARNMLDSLAAPIVRRLDEVSQGPARFARWKGYASAAALVSGVAGIPAGDVHRLIALGNAMTRTVAAPADVAEEVPAPFDRAARAAAPDSLGDLCDPAGPTPLLAPVVEAPRTPPRVLSPLAKAALAGRIGAEKVRIIETTVKAMRIDTAQFEADAVVRAARLSLRQLRVWCLAQFAERDPEAYEQRQELQRPERYLAFAPQADGMVGVHGLLDSATAAHVLAWFGPEVRAAMGGQRGWDEADKRSIGQINADILGALARHAEGCSRATTRPKTTVVVRVPLEVIEKGAGFATCDSLEGPISVSTMRRMAVDAEFLPAVLGGDSLPLDVGRAKRAFTDAQRIAIGERDGGCARCTAPMAWCDTHHIRFWSNDGRSDLRNGLMLCVACHHLVHDCGWEIDMDTRGRVTFIPPAATDPARKRQLASSERLAS